MKVKDLITRIESARSRLALLEHGREVLSESREYHVLNAPPAGDTSHRAARARDGARQLVHGWDGATELFVGGPAGDWLRAERIGLHAIEDEVKDLSDALELLEKQLPSSEEVAEADERISELVDQAGDLRVEAAIAHARLLDQLSEAAESARELAGIRAKYRSAVVAAYREAEDWGRSEDELPPAIRTSTDSGWMPSKTEQRLGIALTKMVRDTVRGSFQVDATAAAEVKSARADLRRDQEAA